MSQELSREDVLFATVAAQLGFAEPSDLAAAAQPGSSRPGDTLADRLVAAGVIRPQERQQIDQQVQLHLTEGIDTIPARPRAAPTIDLHRHQAERTQQEPLPSPPVASATDKNLLALSDHERYRVLGLRAEGGQGRVLVAFDKNIGRDVALKEFVGHKRALAVSDSIPDVERFLREAQVTGQLEHPNIVPVHELARREDGTLYYAMRLVRGETMAERLAGCKTLSERLKLLGAFWDICNAIAFAHSRGVVHRDIKPANVMVNEFGQTVVLDWGVAKVKGKRDITEVRLLRPKGSATRTSVGTAIGTPAYMSPEQARGAIDEIDERSDVWGLGAVLYEILTGRPPFLGENASATMRMVRDEALVPVRQVNPEAPAELATVVQKALQKEPGLRYHSAQHIAEEIDAFMTGGRVGAYTYSAWELLKRYAAQHKTVFTAASLILFVIVGALVAVSIALQAETEARSIAETERRLADFRLAQGHAEKADRLMEEARYPAARVFAAASLLHNPAHPESPNHDAGFGEDVPAGRELAIDAASTIFTARRQYALELERTIQTEDVLFGIAWSRDGGHLATSGVNRKVDVWDAASFDRKHSLAGHSGITYGLALSPDGRHAATTSTDSSVILWDIVDGHRRWTYSGHARGYDASVTFTPDGLQVVVAGGDGVVRFIATESGRRTAAFRAHATTLADVDISADGTWLVTSARDGTVKLWGLPEGLPIRVLGRFRDEAGRLTFSPDARRIAAVGDDRTLRVWERDTGREVFQVEAHKQRAIAVAYSPDGRLLATGGSDATVRLWDAEKGKPLLAVRGHRSIVLGLAFSPDSRRLATAGRERELKVYRLLPPTGYHEVEAHGDYVFSLATSVDGLRMASSGYDHATRVWDVTQMPPRPTRALLGHADDVWHAAFSPSGGVVATASKDATARLWDPATGETLHVLKGHKRYVVDVSFSPDGKQVATGSSDHTIRIWDVASGELVRTLAGHEHVVDNVEYAADGRLYSTSHDNTLRVWDPAAGDLLATLRGHNNWVSGLDVSRDGRWIATSGKDQQIILWDPKEKREIRRLKGHDRWVNTVVFSPDSRLLASSCDGGWVRIWSMEDGTARMKIRTGHSVSGIAFLKDGKAIAVGQEQRIRVYPLDFSILEQDPRAMLDESLAQTGWLLDGFRLVDAPREQRGGSPAGGGAPGAKTE